MSEIRYPKPGGSKIMLPVKEKETKKTEKEGK